LNTNKSKFLEKNLVKALLQLTTSEFADTGAVARVMKMIKDVKVNLEESIVHETAVDAEE